MQSEPELGLRAAAVGRGSQLSAIPKLFRDLDEGGTFQGLAIRPLLPVVYAQKSPPIFNVAAIPVRGKTLIRHRLLAIALAMFATSAYASSVATMGEVSGDVKINQGTQFVAAQPGQAVNAGDRIMAMENSATYITFSDGCKMNINAGTLVTVPENSTCQGGVAQTQQIAPGNADAVGNVPGSQGTSAAHFSDGVDWDYVGTAVIVACLMFCGGDEDNNNTVSP
jgi:hypothetical protein